MVYYKRVGGDWCCGRTRNKRNKRGEIKEEEIKILLVPVKRKLYKTATELVHRDLVHHTIFIFTTRCYVHE